MVIDTDMLMLNIVTDGNRRALCFRRVDLAVHIWSSLPKPWFAIEVEGIRCHQPDKHNMLWGGDQNAIKASHMIINKAMHHLLICFSSLHYMKWHPQGSILLQSSIPVWLNSCNVELHIVFTFICGGERDLGHTAYHPTLLSPTPVRTSPNSALLFQSGVQTSRVREGGCSKLCTVNIHKFSQSVWIRSRVTFLCSERIPPARFCAAIVRQNYSSGPSSFSPSFFTFPQPPKKVSD